MEEKEKTVLLFLFFLTPRYYLGRRESEEKYLFLIHEDIWYREAGG